MLKAQYLTFAALISILPGLTAGSSAVGAASAGPAAMPKSYDACVASIAKKADDAFESALYWRDHGGGAAADHCAALALIALNEPGEAATRLEALAREADAGTLANRAEIMDQSGNAWLLAGENDNAEAAFSAGLKLNPRNATLWLDRGRAKTAKVQWAAAEDDYNHALAFDAARADVYVARAEARTAQGNKGGARSDIDKALTLDPHSADALVGRGRMRWDSGDKKGARADWRDALLNAAPDSDAAQDARAEIEKAEIHVTD